MKPRQRTVCNNCRIRKLGCDGKSPACSQCVLTRQKCEGYPNNWTFVSQNRIASNKKKIRKRDIQHDDSKPSHPTSASNSLPVHPSDTLKRTSRARPQSFNPMLVQLNWPITNQYIDFIVQAYIPGDEESRESSGTLSHVCGSWVEVLPHLSRANDPNGILPTAIKALFASIAQRGSRRLNARPDATESYYAAIQSLQRGFSIPGYRFGAQFVASIMCLCLTELILPKSPSGPVLHANAISGLFEAHGPQAFRYGILHKLFVGFLPLVVVEAFRKRQPTFLALQEWQSEPFSVNPPSIMQRLLCGVATIPSILYKIDQEYDAEIQPTTSTSSPNLCLLTDALTSLELFESLLIDTQGRPNYELPHEGWELSRPALWFPNISIANMFTHLWAFKIVCLAEIYKLDANCSHFPANETPPGTVDSGNIGQHMITLSQWICHSMEYMLQEKMALFGPASTFFPLQIAYRTLREDASKQLDVTYCEQIVARLVEKGFQVAPYFVYSD